MSLVFSDFEHTGSLTFNKRVFAEATRPIDTKLADDILHCKNWRMEYVDHLMDLGIRMSKSSKNAIDIAQHGLESLYRNIYLIPDEGGDRKKILAGNEADSCLAHLERVRKLTLADIPKCYEGCTRAKNTTGTKDNTGPKKVGIKKFGTVCMRGNVKNVVDFVPVTYRGRTYATQQDLNVLTRLLVQKRQVDTIGGQRMLQTLQTIKEMNSHGLSLLGNHWFVLLGATSEVGPFEFLLDLGANIIGIKRQDAKSVQPMLDYAAKSPGNLYLPIQEKTGSGESSFASSSSEKPVAHDLLDKIGCDLMKEPLEIAFWIFEVLRTHAFPQWDMTSLKDFLKSHLTIGEWIYGNRVHHIIVSQGADFVTECLETLLKKVLPEEELLLRRSYFGSPMVTTLVTEEIWQQIELNRIDVRWWMKLLRPIAPGPFGVSVLSDKKRPLRFLHAYSQMQGPSYALAKLQQVWRCIAVEAQEPGRISFHHGPTTETKSVLQSAQLRQLIQSFDEVKPLELFAKSVTKPILGYLLLADVFDIDSWHLDPTVYPVKLEFAMTAAASTTTGRVSTITAAATANGRISTNNRTARRVNRWHVMEVFTRGGQFHGGLLNKGYDMERSKLLAAAIFLRSKL